jgi:hypothetical protein
MGVDVGRHGVGLDPVSLHVGRLYRCMSAGDRDRLAGLSMWKNSTASSPPPRLATAIAVHTAAWV